MHYTNNLNYRCGCISLNIFKTDSVSGAGIPGAVFELTSCNGFTCRGTTSSNGSLSFCTLLCNKYQLREVTAPAGYARVDHVYNICVDACGCIFVDGVPTSQLIIRNTPISASFTAIKVSIENGMPLSGAVYALYRNSSVIARAESNTAGQVTFTDLSPGTYELVETTPPPGFQTNTERLAVMVAQDGSVTIIGQPANGFLLNDVPLSEFAFRKLDASTGLALAGATFVLAQNGTVVGTATSDPEGLIKFGVLAAGIYQLTEIIVPPGFQPNSTVYQVAVGSDGSIMVNDTPLDDFVVEDTPIAVSAPPTIHTVFEGAAIITGTGVPESQIVITLPNGSTVAAIVNANGTWTANVPSGVELVSGNVVSAVQTEPGKLPSSQVLSTVVAVIEVEPGIEIYVENLSTGLDYAQAGDMLLYDAIVSNNGAPSSVWQSAYVTFYLGSSITLQESTIRINNRAASPSQYSYDYTANTLTLYLGDITGGSSISISFRVTVTAYFPDINEIVLNVTLGSLL